MTRTLSVWVGAEIIYLYGTVNGEATTFTLVGAGEWQAVVPRAEDDNYVLHLEAYSANGLEGTYNYTLYYGMMPCITDRSQDDVRRVKELNAKGWEAMTEAERTEWLDGLKGAYNVSDLNRVGHNVAYLADVLADLGHIVSVEPKTDWAAEDIPTQSQMATYLSNVQALKEGFYGTIDLPETMDQLTVEGANNIERLLCEIEQNIRNLIEAWYYCGELYCGEV
ncbi:MAG TPA: hypothetical protein GX745_08515 [Clostridiales bacterium]|nr:hypothetical protein [Clostridiales bacterium]